MYELQQGHALSFGTAQFSLHEGEGFPHQRHTFFKIDGFGEKLWRTTHGKILEGAEGLVTYGVNQKSMGNKNGESPSPEADPHCSSFVTGTLLRKPPATNNRVFYLPRLSGLRTPAL